MIVAPTPRDARFAAAFFRSADGRATFLRALKALVSRGNPDWKFSVELTGVTTVGKVVRVEASAHASRR
jgi:hypothetical protein